MLTLSRCVTVACMAFLCGCDISPPGSEQPSAYLGNWGVDLKNIDTTQKPGNDFYRYVNGEWLKRASIPTGYPVMNSFVEVNLRTEGRLQQLIDSLDSQAKKGSSEQQIYALYQSLLDQDARNRQGLSPLLPMLSSVEQAESHAELAALMARPGFPTLIDSGVVQDFGNPDRVVGVMAQGGLTLPGRDYYLQENLASLRDAYLDYITGVLIRADTTLSESAAKQRAHQVLEFEIGIATRHWPPARTRDRAAAYHLMTHAELVQYAPGFDWGVFLKDHPLGQSPDIIVTSDSAIQELAKFYSGAELVTLKDYMRFRLLNDYALFLTEE